MPLGRDDRLLRSNTLGATVVAACAGARPAVGAASLIHGAHARILTRFARLRGADHRHAGAARLRCDKRSTHYQTSRRWQSHRRSPNLRRAELATVISAGAAFARGPGRATSFIHVADTGCISRRTVDRRADHRAAVITNLRRDKRVPRHDACSWWQSHGESPQFSGVNSSLEGGCDRLGSRRFRRR
jgi:hypothetical protein